LTTLYGIQDTSFLTALGLTTEDAYKTESGISYFQSDTLISALSNALASNETTTKAKLEAYMAASNGTAMPETDGNGKSSVDGLELGLYLFVETKVPENVVDTTAPFLVSLPMTSTDGTGWNYDLTVYPKNETGNPTLEKTVRESKDDTGKNNGSTDDMTDGFAHTATASDGDTVDYQIISTLPTITSPATGLTAYTFVDQLSKGIQYSKNDVQIAFYTDTACTNLVTTWTEADGKFAVAYTDYDSTSGSTMTISMTADGLSEINSATTVYDSTTSNLRGYSNLTMRITYSCKVGSDAAVVYGDNGNPNEVTLTWKRTNTDYYDTLNDDCHVYTYGIDLTKEFSDNAGNYDNVKFLVKNSTDDYYLQAELNESEGIYYVTGHTTKEAEATLFSPMSGEVNHGKILVKGLEDDGYTIIEVATDSGYVLLSENISVEITSAESSKVCDTCGKATLTATAKVNDNTVDMTADNESVNAIVPLTVTNTKGFDLPKTGGTGSKLFYALGILAMITAGATTVAFFRKASKK
jgi:fimbrial isopeptide formation D2 family protein/LPXTG-motif cell wall-anchored protein